MSMNEVLIGLLIAILGALGTWITKTLIPYIKNKTTLAQQDSINYWISTAVSAAEQIYASSGKGEAKLAYVEQFLIDKGIILDGKESKALIESAVLKLKSGVL